MLDDVPDDFPENILRSPIKYHVSFYPSSILCFDGKKSQGHDRIQVMPHWLWRLRRRVQDVTQHRARTALGIALAGLGDRADIDRCRRLE